MRKAVAYGMTAWAAVYAEYPSSRRDPLFPTMAEQVLYGEHIDIDAQTVYTAIIARFDPDLSNCSLILH